MLICDGGRPGIATKKRLSFGMFRIEFLPTRSYSSTSIAAATDQLRSCSASPRDGRQLSGQILSVLYAGVQAVAYLFTAGSVVDRAVPPVRTGFGSAILVVTVAGVMPIGCVLVEAARPRSSRTA